MSALPALHHDAIPAALRERPQWVAWDYVDRPSGRTKVPRNPRQRGNADVTNPETWGTFDEAQTAQEWERHDGIGYVLAASDPFFLIDLDDAYDLDRLHPWAAEIVERFPACYWELSPSQRGVHGIGRGSLPPNGNRRGQVELYDTARFATITGWALPGTGGIGEDCTSELAAFHAELFAPVVAVTTPVTATAPPPPFTDEELLTRALGAKNGEKLRRLLAGDTSDYDSASEADMAAVAMLRFWTADTEQIERVLRLSGLQREKWNQHRTYLGGTITKAVDEPHETYQPPSNVVPIYRGATVPPAPEQAIAGFRLSDLGNGQRLAHRIRGKAMYCHPAKRWYVYDGTRWNGDDRGSLLGWAKASVLQMYDALSSLPDKDRQALLKHALRSESERSLRAAIALTVDEPGIPVLPDEFDRGLMLLNVENGTIDLTTGELRPHDPLDRISRLAPVSFDPEATCPRWLAFLDQIFEGNAEQIRYVQKAIGYTMTGLTIERAVFLLWGGGRNGKSTLLKIIAAILGEYAQKTPTETIMARRNDGGIPNDIAALKGARLVTASETEEGRRLNVSKVKDMSGDEDLTARFLHGEFFKFRPQFTLWLATNHKPILPGNDRAIFDRFRLIPFTYRVPDDQINKNLESELLAESAGILNWMLAGCLAWQAEGLTPPGRVVAATEQYQKEMDQLGSFIADRCITGPEYQATSSALYAAYKVWCEVNGERQNSSNWFGRQLSEREFEQVHDGPKRARTWLGIGLLDDNAGGERIQSVQNGISHIYKPANSREEENPGSAVHIRSGSKSVQDRLEPIVDEEGWL